MIKRRKKLKEKKNQKEKNHLPLSVISLSLARQLPVERRQADQEALQRGQRAADVH